MMWYIKLLYGILSPILLGAASLTFVSRKVEFNKLEFCGLSYALGTGLFSLYLLLACYTRSNILLTMAYLTPVAAGAVLYKQRPTFSTIELPEFSFSLLIFVILVLGVAAKVVFGAGNIAVSPNLGWDGLAIWCSKAKALYWNVPLHELPAQKDYPLLTSLSQAWICRAVGSWDEAAAKVVLFLFYCSLLSCFVGVLQRESNICYALFFGLLLVSSFGLVNNCKNGYVDTVVATYYSLGVIYAFIWMKTSKYQYLLIGSVLAGLAGFTKNEGVFLFLIFWVVNAVFMFFNRKSGRSTLISLLCSVVGFAMFMPWQIIRLGFGSMGFQGKNFTASATFNLFHNLDRLPVIAWYFSKTVNNTWNWGFLWYLLPLLVIYRRDKVKNTNLKYLLLAVVLNAAFIVLCYLGTTAPLVWHLNTAFASLACSDTKSHSKHH